MDSKNPEFRTVLEEIDMTPVIKSIITEFNADEFADMVMKGKGTPELEDILNLQDDELQNVLYTLLFEGRKYEGIGMDDLKKQYKQVIRNRKIQNYIETQIKKNFRREVILGEEYLSRFGEPLKKGYHVTFTQGSSKKDGTLRDFKMILRDDKVMVACLVQTPDNKLFQVLSGEKAHIDGYEVGTYRDKYVKYLTTIDCQNDTKIEREAIRNS